MLYISYINLKQYNMKKNLWHQIINPLNLDISFSNMRFRDNTLEEQFTEDYKTKNVSLALLFTSFGAILFGGFYVIYSDQYPTWFITMMLLSVTFGLTIYYKIVEKYQYAALFTYSLIIVGSYTHRMHFYIGAKMFDIATYFMGLVLLILASNLFLRLKFTYAVLLNILFFAGFIFYSTCIVKIHQTDFEYFSYSTLILFSTIGVICMSIYNTEYMYRNAFVQHKVIREQADELKDAKENTEQKVIERTRELETERAKSLRAIIEGQEIERQRIAQDLHDSLNIRLIGLKRSLEQKVSLTGDECFAEIDSIIGQVREISHNLSPYSLKHLGLVKAIEDLCSRLEREHTYNISFQKVNIDEQHRWSSTLEIELFRVIQELVANIIKHARATTIAIELIQDNNTLYLTIEDNGVGFDYHLLGRKGIGLDNINARIGLLGGSVSYDSRVGSGTTVMINIPNTV
jgi:signal transduction histidine kinase